MKHARLNVCAALLLALAAGAAARASLPEPYEELGRLYSGKQFFELRDELQKHRAADSPELLFYRGVVANKFNRPAQSIQFIRRFLSVAPPDARRSMLKDAHALLLDDYAKTYRYAQAAAECRVLLARYRAELDAEKLADAENALRIWGALAGVPRQTVRLNGGTRLQTSKDKAGLTNVPVETAGQRVNFVFDTGANISTVTRSYARRLGFRVIEADIRVGTSTGARVRARLGVAPLLRIGRVSVRHAVFLVFEDRDLAFPQINYQINGIVGFPIIEALGQVTLTRGGEIIVPPRPDPSPLQNMALDELTPLLVGEFRGRRLTFTFDTGAVTTTFYRLFYEAYEGEIKVNAARRRERIGGAGGSKEVSSYRLKNLALTFAGKQAQFAEARILSDPIREVDRYFYGNLGQDLIKQFPALTLNFEAMSITFE